MGEIIDALGKAAERTGVGFWELVFAICVIILAIRSPEFLKIGSEFLNERRRINQSLQLKLEATRRSAEAAKVRRERAGQKK